MRQFSINGIEHQSPLRSEELLNHLLAHVRQHYSNENSLITLIRVDGLELSEQEEKELAELPLSQLESVEVFTSQPREVAEDTLQTLGEFTRHLETYCQRTVDSLEKNGLENQSGDFGKLIDGISVFMDSLLSAKRILRIHPMSPQDSTALLEADLHSILTELHEYLTKGELAYARELLRQHLPENLQEWREKGIPAIITSRNS